MSGIRKSRVRAPALIAALVLAVPGASLDAQEQEAFPAEPPPAMEAADVRFPDVARDTLENGLETVVVENHEQPVVSVRLYVPAGEVHDPDGKTGTANLVARMLDKGTEARTAEEIAATVEGAGASLATGASDDYAYVATTVLTDRLPTVMEVFADVVQNAAMPEAKLATERKRFASSLEQQLSSAGALASRRFRAEVYGEHPYAEEPDPAGVEDITRQDLTAFHDRRYVPEGSLLVFAGDIDPEAARATAERWFGDWSGQAPAAADFPEPPTRQSQQVLLVHRSGSVQSSMQIGHLGLAPGSPDTYAVDVMNRILGGGPSSRLFRILREDKGWTYGAYSSFSDARYRGTFAAQAQVRNPVTDSAVNETLDQMERIRSEPVGAEELEDAKSYLTGNFPLQIETPQEVAFRVSDVLLRGLDIDYLETYRSRISDVGREEVQQAAKEHLHPDRAAIVVVGDATAVHDQLEGVAPLTLYDADGDRIELADLQVRRSDVALDASRIRRGSFGYSLHFQGNPVAQSTIEVADTDGGNLRFTENVSGAVGSQTTRYVVTPELAPVRVEQEGRMGPMAVRMDLSYGDGRVTGTATVPQQQGGQGQRQRQQPQMEQVKVDTAVAEGTVDQNMAMAAVLASPLEQGAKFEIPVYSPRTGTGQLTATVIGRETVKVPAGSFEVWDVEMSFAGQKLHLFVTRDTPRIMVRQTFANQPIVLELTSTGTTGTDAGGGSGDGGG